MHTGSNTLRVVVSSEPGSFWSGAGCSYEATHKAVPACGERCAGHVRKKRELEQEAEANINRKRAARALARAVVDLMCLPVVHVSLRIRWLGSHW